MALDDSFDNDRYLVSKDGKIFDTLRNKEVKTFVRNGYPCVRLKTLNGYKNFYVHRILANIFIQNRKGLPCINHIDGNKMNNSIDNLEWCTYSENISHAYKCKLRHNSRRITCIETGEEYESVAEASKRTGIGRSAITECLRGRNKTCARKHWKYC